MKRPTIKTVIADDLEQLEAKTADATHRPQTQIDIEDYTAGGTLTLQPGEPSVPADGDDKQQLPPPSEQPMELLDPTPPPDDNAINVLNARRAKIHEQQRAPAPRVPDVFPSSNTTRYESRIRIVEAWQYHGQLAEAPSYVDRGWAAWGDWDEERKIEPGPALRVPMEHGRETEKMCRKGDYVVRQEVTIALGIAPDVRIEVWQKEEFEKFFLPTRTPAQNDGLGGVEVREVGAAHAKQPLDLGDGV
jgi:hypothetical protein